MSSIKTISFLQDSTLMPVIRNYYDKWSIRAFFLEHSGCNNYLSPNRRDYYKVLMITKGNGLYTLGTKTYRIEEPTIFFIPPAEIISWKSFTDHFEAHFCLFKKSFVDEHTNLKAVLDKYQLFANNNKHVIHVTETSLPVLKLLFQQMQEAETAGDIFATDAMQAYLQLIMIESTRLSDFPQSDIVSDEYKHIHRFFELLENETADINYEKPIRIKTVKEFADVLALSPNHLNSLLTKNTGQNASAHIKSRLLDESKALLLQTDWTLQNIGYAIGFSDQPNFSAFFKKLTGLTPVEFRKTRNS